MHPWDSAALALVNVVILGDIGFDMIATYDKQSDNCVEKM